MEGTPISVVSARSGASPDRIPGFVGSRVASSGVKRPATAVVEMVPYSEPAINRTRLVTLKVCNFKSYVGERVIGPIPDSLNFLSIVGRNGTGKSNLMDAVAFAVCCSVERISRGESKNSGSDGWTTARLISKSTDSSISPESVMHGALSPQSSYVELTFRTANTVPVALPHSDTTIGSIANGSVEDQVEWKSVVIKRSILDCSVPFGSVGEYSVNGEAVTVEQYASVLRALGFTRSCLELVFQGDVESIGSLSPFQLSTHVNEMLVGKTAVERYESLDELRKEVQQKYKELVSKRRALLSEKTSLDEKLTQSKKADEMDSAISSGYLAWAHGLCSISKVRGTCLAQRLTQIGSAKETESRLVAVRTQRTELGIQIARLSRELDEATARHKSISAQAAAHEETQQDKERILASAQKLLANETHRLASFVDRKSKLEEALAALQAEKRALEDLGNAERLAEMEDLKVKETLWIDSLSENSKTRLDSVRQTAVEGPIAAFRALFASSLSGSESALKTSHSSTVARISQLESTISLVSRQLDEASEALAVAQSSERELRLAVKECLEEKRRADDERAKKVRMLASLKQKRSTMQLAADADYQLGMATKREMDQRRACEALQAELGPKAVIGRLDDLVTPVSSRFQAAFDSIFGKHKGTVLVADVATAQQCINSIRSKRLAGLTFLPLEGLPKSDHTSAGSHGNIGSQGDDSSIGSGAIPMHVDALNPAHEMIGGVKFRRAQSVARVAGTAGVTESIIRKAMDRLSGSVVIVDDMNAGRQLMRVIQSGGSESKGAFFSKAVTLVGERISASGTVTVVTGRGQNGKTLDPTLRLASKHEIAQLENEIARVTTELESSSGSGSQAGPDAGSHIGRKLLAIEADAASAAQAVRRCKAEIAESQGRKTHLERRLSEETTSLAQIETDLKAEQAARAAQVSLVTQSIRSSCESAVVSEFSLDSSQWKLVAGVKGLAFLHSVEVGASAKEIKRVAMETKLVVRMDQLSSDLSAVSAILSSSRVKSLEQAVTEAEVGLAKAAAKLSASTSEVDDANNSRLEKEARASEVKSRKQQLDSELISLVSSNSGASQLELSRIKNEFAWMDEALREVLSKARAARTFWASSLGTLTTGGDRGFSEFSLARGAERFITMVDAIGTALSSLCPAEGPEKPGLVSDAVLGAVEAKYASDPLLSNSSAEGSTYARGLASQLQATHEQKLAELVETKSKLVTSSRAEARARRLQTLVNEVSAETETTKRQLDETVRELDLLASERRGLFTACTDYLKAHLAAVYASVSSRGDSAQSRAESLNAGSVFVDLVDPPSNGLSTLGTSVEVFKKGIRLHVLPPHKRLTVFSELSGGEKTLVSLSLLFALIQHLKAPLAMFDEVDAALDPGNLSALADYVRTHLSGHCQVVAVSLKDRFYSRSDGLIGVYIDDERQSLAPSGVVRSPGENHIQHLAVYVPRSSKVATVDLTEFPILEEEDDTTGDDVYAPLSVASIAGTPGDSGSLGVSASLNLPNTSSLPGISVTPGRPSLETMVTQTPVVAGASGARPKAKARSSRPSKAVVSAGG